jgi:hypothetical protein
VFSAFLFFPLSNREPSKGEAKMNYMQNQQMWETGKLRQAELIKEAQNVQTVKLAKMAAKMARKPKQSWWTKLFRRQAPSPAVALNPSAMPELR